MVSGVGGDFSQILTIRLVQEDHKHAKVTAAFVNNVSKLGKPKLNRIFL